MKNKKLEKRLMNLYILKSLIELRRNYPYDPESIKKIQQKNLRIIMKRAYEIPLYRKKFEQCGMKPEDFNSAADLEKFPILTKQEFKVWMNETISNDPNKYEYYSKCRTSGTTGIPLTILYSPKELAVNSANWIRVLEMHGYNSMTDSCMGIRAGYRIPKNGDSPLQKLHLFRRKLTDYLLSGEELVEKMNEIKPDLIYGHKSKLVQMAMVVKKKGLDIHKPKYCVPTSEQVDENSLALLKEVFGNGIFLTYGSEENGTSAFCTGFDINKYCVSSDTHIINLMDGYGRYGDKGRLILTSLFQHEFPVINYDIGDSAERVYENGVPYLVSLEGRVDDSFVFLNGDSVARQPFYVALVKRNEISQARFIQLDYTHIKIEASFHDKNAKDNDEVMQKLISDIKTNLKHPEIEYTYEIFDILPTDKNGKIRMLKSYVNFGGGSAKS